jgi:hypothetical protein
LKKGRNSHVQKKRKENMLIQLNQLILDNYLLTDLKINSEIREIEITLYLPKGTLIKPDASKKL